MTTIILIVLGLFIGGAVAEEEGLVLGLFIGLAFGMIATLKGRVFKLEQELARTMKLVNASRTSKETSTLDPEKQPAPSEESTGLSEQNISVKPTLEEASIDDVLSGLNIETKATKAEPKKVKSDWDNAGWQESKPKTPRKPNFADKVFSTVKDFFTKGNVVVKVGAIVLFFGVAFLLKYAADRSLFPIELRLLGVISAGIGLLFVGWRLRLEKLEYGLILQGAGLGMLYLTVFAASKLYHLLPASTSMLMMLLLVVLTGILAVQQNAKSLALFGIVGGFLAPILMSTGSGSHITLFSYYALLNLGIFGIAWFKSWRFLNLVGFIFTFAISGAWGFKAYQSEFFVSTESFLVLFYFFYLTISILFAFKQAPKLKGYVDGSLVFGLPLIVFALQSKLVEQFEYGQAITAIAMAGIYLVLAKLLWQPEKNGFRLLAESFLALGVTFASLAIPLYFDGRWTAAVWSLEGAALVWVGLRQGHFVPRVFGLLLSVGAGIIFIDSIEAKLPDSMAIINSAYIGMVLVSLSAFFIAYLYERNKDAAYAFEFKLSILMIVWGLLWWFMAGLNEVDRYLSNHYEVKMAVLFISLSTLAQIIASHKLKWVNISLSVILFTPVLFISMFACLIDSSANPMAYFGFIAWPVALFIHFLILRRKENAWKTGIVNIWHAAGVWIAAFIITWAIGDWAEGVYKFNDAWVDSIVGLTLAFIVWGLIRWGNKISWPVVQYQHAYYWLGLLPVMLGLLIWQLVVIHEEGTPNLFTYIPVLNPLDITQALAAIVMVYWLRFIRTQNEDKWFAMPANFIAAVAGVMAFTWINVVIARSVHRFAGVNYSDYSMMNSSVFQTSTSIVWSVVAMVLMAVAFRKASRLFWFAGAGLLALVVLKLFFVDLAESGSISRIVSFLVVGGLMLVIGYLSPLPPKLITKQE
ncbi:MAG: DUF2339 domain-containing protein [Methylophaga sp.]|nr:DUF2339 domain-containing protein [Methylophaga sp.]